MADLGRLEPDIRASIDPGDGEIAARAEVQHGRIAHRQLIAIGFGRRAIQHRVETGRLHPVHVGVYAVGHSAPTRYGTLMAAVLACGPGALLSHLAAAELWGLLRARPGPVDVTVPSRGARRRPGVRVHRVRTLHPSDASRRSRIPVTSVPRTMLDLAETMPRDRLERVWEEAERSDLLRLAEVSALCDRARGRRGLRPLRALLAAASLPEPTRSELERRFVALCRDAGLPPPALNVLVAGYEVDAVWQRERLVVELDGYAYHGTRRAFEADRARDAALQLAGYRVVRITWRMLIESPGEVARTIRRFLAGAARPQGAA